jgi:hypothetical protein
VDTTVFNSAACVAAFKIPPVLYVVDGWNPGAELGTAFAAAYPEEDPDAPG